jgi:hypothetical protein
MKGDRMNKFKRFLIFLVIFSVCLGVTMAIYPLLGCAVAGGGFYIAYSYGEK